MADGPADPDLFENVQIAAPATRHPAIPAAGCPAAAYVPQQHARQDVRPASYQTNNQTPFADDPVGAPAVPSGPIAAAKDPCAAVPNKPLNELGISIAQPAGKLPTDLATPCWDQINQKAGVCAEAGQPADGFAGSRVGWPALGYQWDATCFCHQPLYFEEINLERYGYGCGYGDLCCCCLQPAASAAHFYGTVLALPYCMAVECPGDCVYTLGHYRPGSCPPWRWHWPPCDILAANAEAGVLTGLIFAIP